MMTREKKETFFHLLYVNIFSKYKLDETVIGILCDGVYLVGVKGAYVKAGRDRGESRLTHTKTDINVYYECATSRYMALP